MVHNPYRGNFDRAEDIELWVRTNERPDLKIAFVPKFLYCYREFGSASSHKVRTSNRSMRQIAGKYPMSFWDRLRVNSRLILVLILSILYASEVTRLLVQKGRDVGHYSEGNQKLFELELSKISEFHSSCG